MALQTFDPATWLSTFVAIGGGYALASGRKLWLVVDHCQPDPLVPLMHALIGQPERVEALRSAIEAMQMEEAA